MKCTEVTFDRDFVFTMYTLQQQECLWFFTFQNRRQRSSFFTEGVTSKWQWIKNKESKNNVHIMRWTTKSRIYLHAYTTPTQAHTHTLIVQRSIHLPAVFTMYILQQQECLWFFTFQYRRQGSSFFTERVTFQNTMHWIGYSPVPNFRGGGRLLRGMGHFLELL